MMTKGTPVRICRVQDLFTRGKATQKVGEVGVIKDLRIADGSGFGYVVEFKDGVTIWFFTDEVEAIK